MAILRDDTFIASNPVASDQSNMLVIDPTTGVGTPVVTVDRAVFDLSDKPCATPCVVFAPNSPFGDRSTDVAIADLDENGTLDIVAAATLPSPSFAGVGMILTGDGTGDFTRQPDIALPDTATGGVAVGDLNPGVDTSPEIVFGVGIRVRVYEENGLGGYTEATGSPHVAGAVTVQDVTIANLDAIDTNPDIIVAAQGVNTQGSGHAVVFRGDGTGDFGDALSFLAEARPRGVATCNLNIDEDDLLDIALDSGPSIIFNDGTAAVGDPVGTEMPDHDGHLDTGTEDIACGNLDPEDNDFPDLAVVSGEGSLVAVGFGNGEGDFEFNSFFLDEDRFLAPRLPGDRRPDAGRCE